MIEIRTAAETDIPDLHALIESAYRGEASRAGWTTEADLLEGQRTDAQSLAEVLANPASRILMAHRDGALAASIMVEDRGDGVGYFGMLAVSPVGQGQGLGRHLIEAAHDVMRGFGATRARIQVLPQRDTLIAWYERLGYRLTGETAPFPYGDERFGVPLRDDLSFVVMEKAL